VYALHGLPDECDGRHNMLAVVKAIREQTGKRPEDTIAVEVWKDEALRGVEIPVAFEKLLKKEGLSFTHRKEYCRWISNVKKEKTPMTRLTAAVAVLKGSVRTLG
jgi:hypothetical protein